MNTLSAERLASIQEISKEAVEYSAGKCVVAIDIIHFCQKKLVDDFGSLKIERSSLIPLG